MAMNTGKVIVGGLLAGVVMNVGDYLSNAVIFKTEMEAFAHRINPAMTPESMQSFAAVAPWIIIDFLVGIYIVWNYALARPRLGPGPKTAAISVLPIFLTITAVMFGLQMMGMWSMDFFMKSTALYLVTMVLASVVGASVYKEA